MVLNVYKLKGQQNVESLGSRFKVVDVNVESKQIDFSIRHVCFSIIMGCLLDVKFSMRSIFMSKKSNFSPN